MGRGGEEIKTGEPSIPLVYFIVSCVNHRGLLVRPVANYVTSPGEAVLPVSLG